MKKWKIIFVLFLAVFFMYGCEKKKEKETVISNGEKVDTTTMVHEHCTRQGTMDGGEAELKYDIYYTGDVLNILQAEEKVISSNDEVLNTYENAYRGIHEHYKGLEYYDTNVVRGDTTVTSTIVINYDKLSIPTLISIEGEEDNIFENGVPKVTKWKEFAKKLGTKCEKVEE